MSDKISSEKLALEHGLSSEEYKELVKNLGRTPDLNEIGVFSALWSEHCSYKSSKIHLKRFNTTGDHVVQGPGENAGVIDIGDNECICFKMESHNHPSYIEPFQGAATGVGGILRDVFTMGARPIALLDLLRFGIKDGKIDGKNRHIMNGVVAGIAHYGNCMGVPTVGGDTFFHESYSGNPLVNAMCVGYVKKDKIFKGFASGTGNPLIYVGSKTGRDGIHGASMSSDVFSEGEELQRSAVQVGDPFTEKLLLEACLELMKEKDVIVGIQDMGAAGISSSSFEMAERAGTGVLVHFDKVPTRAKNMTPYELMLSESQERMLMVVKKGKEKVVGDIFEKWGLSWEVIGEVIKDKVFRGLDKGKNVFELPIALLSGDNAPRYDRKRSENKDRIKRYAINLDSEVGDLKESEIKDKLLYLLSHPNICSKHSIYEQYDYMVRTNTVVHPGWDGALLRIKGGTKGIGLSTSSKNRATMIEPFLGSAYSTLDGALNILTMGCIPLAITDCMNFGSPEDPSVMEDFSKSVDGINKVSKLINMPIVSGNVSFYNQTDSTAILPTPSIGVVGLIKDVSSHITPFLKKEGNNLYLINFSESNICGSEYISNFYPKHEFSGRLSKIDFDSFINFINFVKNEKKSIYSMHDTGLGGVIVELSKMIIYSKIRGSSLGINLNEKFINGRLDKTLFGEGLSVIVEGTKDIEYLFNKYNLDFKLLGKVSSKDSFLGINSEELVNSFYKEM